VTHNLRILHKLKVDRVYIIKSGKLAAIGNKELLKQVQENGFKNI
jgi:Fe-S cluster assembly ATPase SufC